MVPRLSCLAQKLFLIHQPLVKKGVCWIVLGGANGVDRNGFSPSRVNVVIGMGILKEIIIGMIIVYYSYTISIFLRGCHKQKNFDPVLLLVDKSCKEHPVRPRGRGERDVLGG